ncbi:MAG: hypothetical protein QXM00_10565 [Candidatus Bathyarchaeia archaeon]
MREKSPCRGGFKSHLRTNTSSFGAVHISLTFKFLGVEFNVAADMHDYVGRLRREAKSSI